MHSRITTLLLPALLLALPHSATAQWTPDPWNGMVTVCDEVEDQFVKDIIALEGGRVCVLWEDDRYGFIEFRAFYQILDRYGKPLLEENGRYIIDGDWIANLTATIDHPIISDGEGGCIVVFHDYRDSTRQIYGQRLDSFGEKLWGPNGLPLVISPGEDQTLKDLTADENGNYFICWDVEILGHADTYAQKFDVNGNRLWGDSGVTVAADDHYQYWPQGVPDQQGGLMVIWEDNRLGGYTYYLYAQHLDASGNPLWPINGVRLIHLAGGSMTVSYVYDGLSDGAGGAVWLYIGGSWGYMNVFRMAPDGDILWENYVSTSMVYTPCGFLLHPSDSTLWVNVWENISGPETVEYYLYRYDLDTGQHLLGSHGVQLGGESMVATSDGVITFEIEYGQQGTRLFATRVDSSGQEQWSNDVAYGGVPPGGGPMFAYPTSTFDNYDGAIVAFIDISDYINTGWNIQAQRITWDGQVAYTRYKPPLIHTTIDAPISYRNGSIYYTLPQAGNVTLGLYDILERYVNVIDEGYRQAGSHVVHFSNQNLPSGIYLLLFTTPSACQTAKIIIVQ